MPPKELPAAPGFGTAEMIATCRRPSAFPPGEAPPAGEQGFGRALLELT